MKGYLINAFTPMVSNDSDTRFERIGNLVINVLYCTFSIVTILALGIFDPLEFGHIETAAAAFLIMGGIGVLIQRIRRNDFEEAEKDYEKFMTEYFEKQNKNAKSNSTDTVDTAPIDQENGSSNAEDNAGAIPEAAQKTVKKRGRRKLEDGENPIYDDEYNVFFNKIMESLPNHSLDGVNVTAISKVLWKERVNLGKLATKDYSSVQTIAKWISITYPNKIATGLSLISLQKGKPSEEQIDKWKDILTRS